MIDAGQIRAARALLALSQSELAELASLSAATVKRLKSATVTRGTAESVWKIETALERLGIEFISAEGERGSGVRLRKKPKIARKR